MIETIITIVELVVKVSSSLINILCIIILIKYVVLAIILLFKSKYDMAKKKLTNGINTALTFNLAGEVMKIVVSKEMRELYIIGTILLLKVLIAFLLHFEEKWEKEEEIEKKHKK